MERGEKRFGTGDFVPEATPDRKLSGLFMSWGFPQIHFIPKEDFK